jgi:hypothetical protein
MYLANAMMKAFKAYHGAYRGYVEYINDPMQVGRVKVRVPAIHGLPAQVPTEGLPWAYVTAPFGGGHDFGSKMIPPVGTTVFVMFEMGSKEFPIVIGTWDGTPSKPALMGRNFAKTLPKGKISMSPTAEQPWIAPPGADSPKEFLLQANNAPERYVPFKSPKGAVIDIEDRDEVEHTNIVDRAGQGLFMDSPVKATVPDGAVYPGNLSNQAQRGLRTSAQGDALPLESTIVNESSVVLVDLGGQSITLHTKDNANSILLSSKQGLVKEPTVGGNKETPGVSNAILELSSGHKLINLEITSNGASIAKLAIDGTLGVVTISSPLMTKINSENIILDGDVSISGNLTVDKTISSFENGLFIGEVVSSRDTGKGSIPLITPPAI